VYGAHGPQTAEYMRWGLLPWFTKAGQKQPLSINAKALQAVDAFVDVPGPQLAYFVCGEPAVSCRR
jgi:hypothetical protein